jgi:hypothetical protein
MHAAFTHALKMPHSSTDYSLILSRIIPNQSLNLKAMFLSLENGTHSCMDSRFQGIFPNSELAEQEYYGLTVEAVNFFI